MKMPFYLRKTKCYVKDGKLWADIRINKVDKMCLYLIGIWRILRNES